jgi:sugar phosphate permease
MVRMWRARILTTTWLSYAVFYFCRKNFAIAKSSIMSSMEISRSDVAHIFTTLLKEYPRDGRPCPGGGVRVRASRS